MRGMYTDFVLTCEMADNDNSPGRFFVGAEMKLILAHLLLNFDIKPTTKNQTQRWFGTVYIPSDAPYKVRRRTPSMKGV